MQTNNNSNNIEGIQAVTEALNHKTPIDALYIAQNLTDQNNPGINNIQNFAKKYNIKTKHVDKKFLDKISFRGRHQGVIAQVKPFVYTNLNVIVRSTKTKNAALIIILDHIKDAGNLGAIARTAEAVGASGIIIPNKRSANVNASTYKTSTGAITHLPIACVANISSAIQQLKKNDFWICGASEHASENIWNTNLKGKIALVMGAEHEGISNLVLKNCDFTAKLPILGDIESLNVAQSCSICAYEWVRQNKDALM